MYFPGLDMIPSLEGGASLAGCLRQSLDATVVLEAAAVEDDGLDPLLGGLAGERFAHQLGDLRLLLAVALAAQAGLQVGRRHQRMAAAACRTRSCARGRGGVFALRWWSWSSSC